MSLYQHEGPWPAAVRGHAWDGEREGGEKDSDYRAGKWAHLLPAPQVRKWGNNGARETKEQAQQISLGRECVCGLSAVATSATARQEELCRWETTVCVCEYTCGCLQAQVWEKNHREKGRRTKKRPSVHWFEQNRFLCSCILGLTTQKKIQNESQNLLMFFFRKVIMPDHWISYFSQLTWL